MTCFLCGKELPPKIGYSGGRSRLYCDHSCRIQNHRNVHMYEITNEEYRKIMDRTDCEICHRELPLVFDHDHKTNKARGALCQECNRGLGQFSDDPERISNALIYLQKASERAV